MNSDAQTKVAELQASNASDATTLAGLLGDLTSTAGSPGDQALAAVVPVVVSAGLVQVFGADALKSALEADGFLVTAAPAPATPTDGTPAA